MKSSSCLHVNLARRKLNWEICYLLMQLARVYVLSGEKRQGYDPTTPCLLLYSGRILSLFSTCLPENPVGGNEIQFSPDSKLTIRALEMAWERQGSTTGKKWSTYRHHRRSNVDPPCLLRISFSDNPGFPFLLQSIAFSFYLYDVCDVKSGSTLPI